MPNFWRRKYLSPMLDYVGKDLANNNPRCVIAVKKSNCEP
jgi:hypothetical protein